LARRLPSIAEHRLSFADNQEMKSWPKEKIEQKETSEEFSSFTVSYSNGDSNNDMLRNRL
jgi:hypothetical protein